MNSNFRSEQHGVRPLGPFVIKRILGSNAQRRFHSEVLTRVALKAHSFESIPVIFAIPPLRLLVLPRMSTPQASAPAEGYIWELARHVDALAERSRLADCSGSFSWLDRSDRVKPFSSFTAFLTHELNRYTSRYGNAFLCGNEELVSSYLNACPYVGDRTICLHDVCPKNVFLRDGRFIHFDLENTLIGPAEYMLIKTATNLVRDCGTTALSPAIWLIGRCNSQAVAEASLVFAIVRMLVFYHIYGGNALNPANALSALRAADSMKTVLEELALARDARSTASTVCPRN